MFLGKVLGETTTELSAGPVQHVPLLSVGDS
jgi:hypothetical protein